MARGLFVIPHYERDSRTTINMKTPRAPKAPRSARERKLLLARALNLATKNKARLDQNKEEVCPSAAQESDRGGATAVPLATQHTEKGDNPQTHRDLAQGHAGARISNAAATGTEEPNAGVSAGELGEASGVKPELDQRSVILKTPGRHFSTIVDLKDDGPAGRNADEPQPSEEGRGAVKQVIEPRSGKQGDGESLDRAD